MSVDFKPPVTAKAVSDVAYGPLGPDAEGVRTFKGIATGLVIGGGMYLLVIAYFLF